MDNSIIHQIYFGKIDEAEYPFKEVNCDDMYQAYDDVCATLNDEQRKLFETYVDLRSVHVCEELEIMYQRGFKTGALLALEIQNFKK